MKNVEPCTQRGDISENNALLKFRQFVCSLLNYRHLLIAFWKKSRKIRNIAPGKDDKNKHKMSLPILT